MSKSICFVSKSTTVLLVSVMGTFAGLTSNEVKADTINIYNLDAVLNTASAFNGTAGTSYGTLTVDENAADTQITYTFDVTTGAIYSSPGGNGQGGGTGGGFGIQAVAGIDVTGSVASYSETANNGPTGNVWANRSGSQLGKNDLISFPQAVTCYTSSGAQTACGTTLTITVTGTGLGIGDESNADDSYTGPGAIFISEIDGATPGDGAAIGATTDPIATTPIPGSLMLFASVAGILGFGLRRKPKNELSFQAVA